MDAFLLSLELNVHLSPQLLQAQRRCASLEEANALIFEFIKEHGKPDAGMQSISVVLVSSIVPEVTSAPGRMTQ